MTRPSRIAVLYVPADQPLAQEFIDHLAPMKQEGMITVWHSESFGMGDVRRAVEDQSLHAAELIFFLLSASALANTDFVKQARMLKEKSPAQLRTIRLGWCDVAVIHPFKELPLMLDGQLVSSAKDKAEVWFNICQEIRRILSPLTLKIWVDSVIAPSATRDIKLVPRQTRCDSFAMGASIRIGFHADRDCHVILVNRGTSGRITQIYPSRHGEAAFCRGTVNHYFPRPADPFEYRLDGPPGREQIVVLARLEPIGPDQMQLEAFGDMPGWARASYEFEVCAG